ncbi:anti sigma factor C-terminal domain-containing protein [Bacillus sp. ISL-47]|uniref:anti-sigma factor n=1 Tax=Bacillus sp. ISL-47 TaxID=2819130 RepID=UPI001BE821D4|nr:anti-sigma factor [Bacillus sp. ISL-47]MBT2688636.1 anti sigma factor C-terminal domain-containing protein [Bacillus sp. ISL-47]MBT2710622.1 anti sigma factor C-terminal domain-containing protein [Pseudomonas sp. ISL-84]
MSDWNKDREKKIMTKYRFTLTMRVLRVLAACLLLFWVYMMAVNIISDAFHTERKHAFYSKLALDWKHPNLHENFGGFTNKEVTAFLTHKISYPITRKVGQDFQAVGEVQIEKRLFNAYSTFNIQRFEPGHESIYRFSLPENPNTGATLTANEDPKVWTPLSKIHEGTVGELAFSTKSYMKPEELMEMLKPYDLEVLWMPLYTGELKEFQIGYGSGGDSIELASIYGLTGAREAGDDYMSESKLSLTEEFMDENKATMLKQMENLLENKSQSYYENFLGLDHLEERHKYLKENGFKVYGAVVTGPVKELLKLKEEEQIRSPYLGELDYWNWE